MSNEYVEKEKLANRLKKERQGVRKMFEIYTRDIQKDLLDEYRSKLEKNLDTSQRKIENTNFENEVYYQYYTV